MNSFTITPEEYARWPEETKVLFDAFHEKGQASEVSPFDVVAALSVSSRNCSRYRMTSVYRRDMDINASAYSLWATSAQPGDPFDPETVKEWGRRLLHFDCPLFNVEAYDMHQREVPVHEKQWEWTVDWYRQPFIQARWEQAAMDLAIYGTAAMDEHGNIINPVDLTARDIDTSDLPDVNGPMLVIDETSAWHADWGQTRKPSRVPSHVQKHQPRLDGRRR